MNTTRQPPVVTDPSNIIFKSRNPDGSATSYRRCPTGSCFWYRASDRRRTRFAHTSSPASMQSRIAATAAWTRAAWGHRAEIGSRCRRRPTRSGVSRCIAGVVGAFAHDLRASITCPMSGRLPARRSNSFPSARTFWRAALVADGGISIRSTRCTFAREMQQRLNLPCRLALNPQTEFPEPRNQTKADPPDECAPGWHESDAWDELAAYYCQGRQAQ